MATILGLSGSLREGSLNSSLIRASIGLMPEGSSLFGNEVRAEGRLKLWTGNG